MSELDSHGQPRGSDKKELQGQEPEGSRVRIVDVRQECIFFDSHSGPGARVRVRKAPRTLFVEGAT